MNGEFMDHEMAEQPGVLAGLARRFDDITAQVSGVTRGDVPGVAFLARGSSDNAALLGRYAVGLYTGLPTCLVAPSLTTLYRRPAGEGFAGWLVVALSQSGRTPEIVTLARDFERAGARVLGVTNDPDSDLASSVPSVVLGAGPERAVPATKTVSAQQLVMLAVASGLGAPGFTAGRAAEVASAAGEVLADPGPADDAARRLARCRGLVVGARGLVYPAALETALKLQETTGIMAHGFSSADLRHGPIALTGPDVPALLLAGSGAAGDDTRALRPELAARGAETITAGTGEDADIGWPAVGDAGECVLATVRGQQLARALCRELGVDPDQPSGLAKVTLTH